MRKNRKCRRFVTRLICTGISALAIVFPAVSQTTKAGPRIELGEGIVATVVSLRSWENYDGQVPEKPYEYWRTAKGTLIKPMPNFGHSSLLVRGASEMTVGEDSFKSTITPFVSGEYPTGLKAAGRFVEMGLRIANAGDAVASLFLIDAAKPIVDAAMVDKKGKYPVTAFLMPGNSIAPVSMITEWSGGLGVDLGPGAATWILLVFDLPPETKEAEFRLLNSKPVKLSIPEWTKIEPSATYYTGDIVKGSDQPDQSGGSTFSSGTFSFWLRPDRTAVVKFSVVLKGIQWVRGGESAGSTEAMTKEFSDFTLYIANNKISANIPLCYDVLGAFSSPTQASGTIHLHHFSPENSNAPLDLGAWEWKAAAARE
ncbi:MAG: hypothetical protein ABSF43_02545 [Rectinemataceae bacterium]